MITNCMFTLNGLSLRYNNTFRKKDARCGFAERHFVLDAYLL